MSQSDVPEPGRPDGAGPAGSLSPTPVRALLQCVVVGLVLGWLVRPAVERLGGTAPIVTWGQPAALALVAVILGATAWLTHRAVHVRRQRLEPHQAVNRLVMARACARVGAGVGGAYFGYALSQLGLAAELADERAVRSGLAGLACVAVCVTGLLLERACRVRSDDEPL
ncbi:MAG: DUF3180 domain-containing protein [Nocardioides sp.]|nr:DUF3180 domain-containing protein [Nocardioides sp.]